MREADAIDVEADGDSIFATGELVREAHVGGIAELLLVMQDADVAEAVDLVRIGIELVLLDVAPLAVGIEPVDLVVDLHALARLPARLQARPGIAIVDPAVAHVVVLVAQRLVELPLDQRRAEILHRVLIAVVMRERQAQCVGHIPLQRARDSETVAVAAVDPVVGLVVADVEAIGPVLAQRAGEVDRCVTARILAEGQLDLCCRRLRVRLPRHDVDHAADRALSVHHGRGPVQHFDAIHGPRIERERDGAGTDEQPRTVEQMHDRAVADEAAGTQSSAAVAGSRFARDAGGAGHGFDDARIAALADHVARQHLDARGREQRRQVEPGAGPAALA